MNNSKYEQYLSRLGCCCHRFPDSSNHLVQEIISPSIKRRTKIRIYCKEICYYDIYSINTLDKIIFQVFRIFYFINLF